jgi:hypothetical protein
LEFRRQAVIRMLQRQNGNCRFFQFRGSADFARSR